MNVDGIGSWLKKVGSEARGRRGEWVEAPCPLARWRHEKGTDSKPSFAVKLGPGESFVNCFSCGFAGRQSAVVTELMALTTNDPTARSSMDLAGALNMCTDANRDQPLSLAAGVAAKPEEVEDPLIPAWWLQSFARAWDVEEPRGYVLGRGATLEAMKHFDLRWDEFRGRLGFPIRDAGGQLRGMQGRTLRDDKIKYLHYTFNGECSRHTMLNEQAVDPDRPVVAVEGPFDALKVWTVYPNVVALMGTHVTAKRRIGMARFRRVVALLDGDKAGREAAKRLRRAHRDVVVVHLPQGADPGGMSFDDIKNLLDTAGPKAKLALAT